jgi:hypothetical protein
LRLLLPERVSGNDVMGETKQRGKNLGATLGNDMMAETRHGLSDEHVV